MFQLDGYAIQEMIYEGSHSQVFRGRCKRDGLPVVIKAPSSSNFSIRENLRYQNEYNMLVALRLSRIVHVHNLVQYRAGYAIIEEDYGASALDQWLNGRIMEPPEFFTVAIQMAEGLVQVHGQGIIHKDINPSNILIHPETMEVKLTDFWLSTLIEVETQEACAPELIEGTLPYVSPEQTGRMNRAIDYRTDLYSLGICYYQMLTGAPPFVTTDLLEMVHCHIARSPVLLCKRDPKISPLLSGLVMKLLEKKAEDRYQSAHGVMQDLLALQTAMRNGELMPELELGRNDVSDRFQVTHRLYGREQETRQLLDAFNRVAFGRSELLLIGGYSGIGKTSLVNEVQKSLVRQRGYFISGKHDQFQRDIPFFALIQAFRRLVSQILTEPEEQIRHWREALNAALVSNARVIIDVIPNVEWIMGPQPVVPELDATEAQNRFRRSFQQFISVFASPEHPLVVFLDDLQWADAPSLALMELLCANPDSRNLLMIGAYRDNEVSASHPLTLTLNRMSEEGSQVQTILLAPLSFNDLNQMTADTLHQPFENVQELSRLLLKKTGGNPFFVAQFLKEIHTQGWFLLDPASGRWQWDITLIETAGMTDNVVDMMMGKIARMSDTTQQALKLAACIGNRFELEVLAAIQGRSKNAAGSDLWEAIQEGLVLTADTELRFLHDRVQQAAFSMIAQADIAPLHLKIGRQLWHRASRGELDDQIFDITGHLNAGMSLINDPDERFNCSLLNLQAGRKAKASTAYASAMQHFQAALNLLATDSWENKYRHTMDIYCERADVAYLLGRFAEAEADFDEAMAHATDCYDQAESYLQLILQYNQLGKYNDLVAVARTALGLFGVTLPNLEDQAELRADYERQMAEYSRLLNKRPLADLIKLDDVSEREQDCIIRLMAILTDGTYIAIPTLFPHVVMEVVNRAMRYGHNGMTAIGFAWATVLIVRQFGNYQDAYELGSLAMRLNERYPNPRIRSQVTFLYAVCSLHWVQPLESQIKVYQQAYQLGIDNGNLVFAGYARTMIPKTTLAAFTVDKALEECAISVAFYSNSGSPFLMSERFCHLFLQRLSGVGENLSSLSTDEIKENAWLDHWQQPETLFGHGLAYFLNFKLQLLYLFGQWQEAWDFANVHADWMQYIPILYETTVFTFYRALSGVSIYEQVDTAEQAAIFRTISGAIADFSLWTANCPDNFAWQEQLLRAELARIEQRPKDALIAYGQAAALARHYHRLSGQALSQERAGRLHLLMGQRKLARPELEEAVFHYYRWGAIGKANSLNQEFAELLSSTTLTGPISFSRGTQSAKSISTHKLDLDTVVKASLVISSEIILNSLLQKLMAIFIENAGAERGCLLIPGQEQWSIAAQACVTDQDVRLERVPLEAATTTVCEAVIRYVIRTGQLLTLDDASEDSVFGRDPYVLRQSIRSVLCLPLLAQNQLKGLLYLENNKIAGAFVSGRIEILNMLSAQAAISIVNAQLYENIERQVANERILLQRSRQADMGEMISAIAHQWRQPLATVSVIFQNLLAARKMNKLDEEYLEKATTDATAMIGHMSKTIDAFRDYFKPEKSKEMFNAVEKIEDAVSFISGQLKAGGIIIILPESTTTECVVNGFPNEFTQVILNLLANARDAILERRKTSSGADVITISILSTGSQIVIEVRDTGCGIPEEAATSIFKPYYTTKDKGEGTGIGAYISKQIIEENMGGKLTFTSKPGETIFRMELPNA